MILNTDTQITDQALLETSQQDNITQVCQKVKELIDQPKYSFRVFEWTARVENGKITRIDKTLLSYYDFYPNDPNTSRDFLTNLTGTVYYRERVKIMRRIGKLRDDQFIEFEVYDQLSEKSSKSADWKNYLTN